MFNIGTKKFRILDLFSGAGGAAMGLHRAFPEAEITGIDIKSQPRYPFNFVQADALEFPLGGYGFIWASPPCQAFSAMRKGRWQDREHPDLVAPTRERLVESGAHWCIENVMGAPLINPIMLCGTMFGMETKGGSQLIRHRIFETSFDILFTPYCQHKDGSAIGVYGGGQHPERRKPATIGVWGHAGGSSSRDGLIQFNTRDRRDAMGIDWMTGNELSQAIPPAYSEFIGRQLRNIMEKKRAAG